MEHWMASQYLDVHYGQFSHFYSKRNDVSVYSNLSIVPMEVVF